MNELRQSSVVLARYAYLGRGQPVIAGYPDQPQVELTYFANGATGEAGDPYTGLDRFGRVTDQRWRRTVDDTDVDRFQYGYDRGSSRLWRENTVAAGDHDEHYDYDGLNQVKNRNRGTLNANKTGISGTPEQEEVWNYDPAGNWRGTQTAYLRKENGSTVLDQNRTHSVANEITDITANSGTPWPTPAHDAAGNMISIPPPLSLSDGYDLKWDGWNRLVEVRNAPGLGGAVVATYRYDGEYRRVSKEAGGQTRHYYYSDQWQVLEERLDQATTADRHYVWGTRAIDDLVLRDRPGVSSERLYSLSDAMGSVTSVVNTSGTVQERYAYDGFGAPSYMDASFGNRTSSSFAWETLFHAYRYDLETGLYQVRYRFYHPNLGRWISRDPVGEKGGLNSYRFVNNNPFLYFDLKGLTPLLPFVAKSLIKSAAVEAAKHAALGYVSERLNRIILATYVKQYCMTSPDEWMKIRLHGQGKSGERRFLEKLPQMVAGAFASGKVSHFLRTNQTARSAADKLLKSRGSQAFTDLTGRPLFDFVEDIASSAAELVVDELAKGLAALVGLQQKLEVKIRPNHGNCEVCWTFRLEMSFAFLGNQIRVVEKNEEKCQSARAAILRRACGLECC